MKNRRELLSVCVCVTVYERKRDGGALPVGSAFLLFIVSARCCFQPCLCLCDLTHSHSWKWWAEQPRNSGFCARVLLKDFEKEPERSRLEQERVFGIQPYCNWQHSWLQCSPAAEWKILSMTWHEVCERVWDCVCVHNTHERERAGRRRSIRGGWAVVQTDSKGLDGGKAAFVRSQPPQQLPPIWRTLCEKINPAHSKWMKHPIHPVGRSITVMILQHSFPEYTYCESQITVNTRTNSTHFPEHWWRTNVGRTHLQLLKLHVCECQLLLQEGSLDCHTQ